MLLDTTFLIDLMNGDEGAVAKARELENDLVQQRLSAMTLFELYYGVARTSQIEAEVRRSKTSSRRNRSIPRILQ